MKKTQLNLAHRDFTYLRKYRNLYLRLREMLKTGIYQSLNAQVQRTLQRKLDIYYRRLSGNRLLRGAKVAMLTASFAFLCNTMHAQNDSTWVNISKGQSGFNDFYYPSHANLVTDINNDGLDDIICLFNNEVNAFSNTGNAEARFEANDSWINSRSKLSELLIDGKERISWVDYDQDGDLDILLNEYYETYHGRPSIRLFKNDGDFNFTEITEDSNPFKDIEWSTHSALLDVDQDGDLDVLSFFFNYDTRANGLKLYRNASGDNTFNLTEAATPTEIEDISTSSTRHMRNIDMDGDGMDELIIYEYGNILKVYENDFANSGKIVLDKEQTNCEHFPFLFDTDNDNDLDLFTQTYNGPNQAYENQENDFASLSTNYLTPGPLYTLLESNDDLQHFVDVDNDGDLDFLTFKYYSSPSASGYAPKVFLNTGDANNPDFNLDTEWTENPFTATSIDQEYTVDAAWLVNLDDDADLELLVKESGYIDPYTDYYRIIYYNDNGGTIEKINVDVNLFDIPDGDWTQPILNLTVADIDNDGDNDIFFKINDSSNSTHKLHYVENTGTSQNPVWTIQSDAANNPLSTIQLEYGDNLKVADINGNGKNDLILSQLESDYYATTITAFINTSEENNVNYEEREFIANDWLLDYKMFADLNGNGFIEAYTRNFAFKRYGIYEYQPIIRIDTLNLIVNDGLAAGTKIADLVFVDNTGTGYTHTNTIASGNDNGWFAITNNTELVIAIDANIDYEVLQNTELKLAITSTNGTNTYHGQGIVNVKVGKLNNNTPAFAAIATDITIDENSAEGTALLTLSATDADGSLNNLVYNSADAKVVVNATTGAVTLAADANLDYETATSLVFDVKVSDGTNEDTETVTIAINNLNDNAPVMAAIATDLSVNENSAEGTALLTLSATDADGSLNNLVYSSADAKVVVNATTGAVTLAADANLDYETATSLVFDIKVSDGTNEDTETVTIAINNVNDIAPVLDAIATDLNVDENSAEGTALLTLSATDADGSLNNLVYSSTDAKVVVNATTGAVTLAADANLDYETATSLVFDVKVSDGTNEDTETVTIAINNLNDNAPVMAAIATDINVDENSAEGTALVTLSATDADGSLNNLAYSSTDAKVVINATTGAVTLAADANIDYETATSLVFDVKVSDGTNEDTETVTIAINNLNDNAPVMADIATDLSVNENSGKGTELLTLSANDADSDALTYSTSNTIVAIDAASGVVSIQDSAYFDAEVNDSLSFMVKVSDGAKMDSATVKIAINNINDNAPVLESITREISVDENSGKGTELLTLSASDADNIKDGLVFTTSSNLVSIDSQSGKITIADASYFDAETNTNLTFDVKVSDGVSTDSATISISINNLNDNAPVFSQESYEVSINDSEIDESVLLSMQASDADQLEAISYSISDGYNVFELSSEGELTIINIDNIDVSSEVANYELTALASDGELSGETTIYVSINITTGIVTVMQNMSVSIYPNPAVSEATIEIPEMEDEATISVYNTNGALVMQQVVTSQVSKIKVGDLNQGIYLVSIQSANKMSQKRLVIE